MTRRECSWCRFVRDLYTRDMAAELTDYIASLPEDVKVSEAEHAQRLAVCSKCGGNVNGLCRYCGCYVAARAAKKGLGCPHPEGEMWTKSHNEHLSKD